MANQESKLSSLLLKEYFGPVLESICNELTWCPKPLKLLSSSVNLPISTVKQALSILIHFNFVEYKASKANNTCEYALLPENILLISRYSKFIAVICKKYSKEAEVVVLELLLSGKMTLSNLILKVAYVLSQGNSELSFSLSTIKDSVRNLIDDDFLIPVERVTEDVIPVPIKLTDNEKNPDINLKKLSGIYHGTDTDLPTNELYWKVNFERFLVEYRNEIFVNAMTKRFDSHAGIVMNHLLKLSHKKLDYWAHVSSPISIMQLKESIGNNSNSFNAFRYAEQYIKIMEEDSSNFITRSMDFSGGVIICVKDAVENLASYCVGQIIDQKYGSKAARVFRLIKEKKYCELEQIQQLAMLPDKEAKFITYKLLEENFVQMQELRKPTTSNTGGPNKAFFLFYVDINMIVRLVLTMCYKSLYNIILRKKEEENKHIHIIEKKRQADMVILALRKQGISEDQITEMVPVNEILSPPEKTLLDTLKRVTKKLQFAELQIDETIFILQLYIRYNKTTAPPSKLKKS